MWSIIYSLSAVLGFSITSSLCFTFIYSLASWIFHSSPGGAGWYCNLLWSSFDILSMFVLFRSNMIFVVERQSRSTTASMFLRTIFFDDVILVTKLTKCFINEIIMCCISLNGSMKKRWVFRGTSNIILTEMFNVISSRAASCVNKSLKTWRVFSILFIIFRIILATSKSLIEFDWPKMTTTR